MLYSIFDVQTRHEELEHTRTQRTHTHTQKPNSRSGCVLFMDPFHCFNVLHKLGIIAFESFVCACMHTHAFVCCVVRAPLSQAMIARARVCVSVLYEQNMYI